MSHWAGVVDDLCKLDGEYAPEFTVIERAVDVARHYPVALRFPTLLEELPEPLLDGAAFEADSLRVEEKPGAYLLFPMVLALTLAAHSLLHGEGEEAESTVDTAELDESAKRVGLFVLIEKMRRFKIYETVRLPFDPWDDETEVVCEGENRENMLAFQRWLGYGGHE